MCDMTYIFDLTDSPVPLVQALARIVCRVSCRAPAVCCSALQYVAVCFNEVQCVAARIVCHVSCRAPAVRCSALQCVAVCCSVLQLILSTACRVICLQ